MLWQVFVDGATPVRKNLGRMFEDTVKESLVREALQNSIFIRAVKTRLPYELRAS